MKSCQGKEFDLSQNIFCDSGDSFKQEKKHILNSFTHLNISHLQMTPSVRFSHRLFINFKNLSHFSNKDVILKLKAKRVFQKQQKEIFGCFCNLPSRFISFIRTIC